MATYIDGDTRVVLQPPGPDPQPGSDLGIYQGNGSVVLDSRRTRPQWFDGRFLAARDLLREQNYFLLREADLAKSPGFGVTAGLLVDAVPAGGGASAGTVVIRAGQGVTPAGELVGIPSDLTVRLADLAEEQSLDVQFGISTPALAARRTRTGLYVIGLRPVEFTANPIAAYPTMIGGAVTKHDGDIVEATAVSLVPWPGPASNYGATTRNAALARQIFLTGNPGQLPDSLLPLAILSLSGGAIEWLDPWLVRREKSSGFTGLRLGLTDPPTQQAYLLQYDSQLQQAVNALVGQKLPARFPATNYFQALPPAGRFPLASIDADAFTQTFFPPQMDVRLSVIPNDELPALMADAMTLPPIDLTLPANAYANITVFALIPVPRRGFSTLQAKLPTLPLTSVLPQVIGNRRPIDLLRFYQGAPGIVQASGTDNSPWQATIGSQTYGYYVRRLSAGSSAPFTAPPPPVTTTPPPTTTSTTTTTRPTPSTTSTTRSPTTTTSTTTAAPTTSTTSTTRPPTTTTTTSTSTTRPPTTTTTTTTARPTTSTTTSTTRSPTTTTTTTSARPTTSTTRRPTNGETIAQAVTRPTITATTTGRPRTTTQRPGASSPRATAKRSRPRPRRG
jgi:hypothetical protein